MQDFQNIQFRGTFRDYQRSVLDHTEEYLCDGRLHIVAAPGSGKTILGLELIRRLGKPALILSPGVTIRRQWGERFQEKFLPPTEEEASYVSYDLQSPSLITSVTYQALHAAMAKRALAAASDEDSDETEQSEDFSDFDLMATLQSAGVGTLCLDEAHHLKSEWQRALERFLTEYGIKLTLISLTATPPYDSTPAEWQRYISLCGPIDEEIFVPQLVAQRTLCPHQDYVYLSFPTKVEQEAVEQHRQKAQSCLDELSERGVLTALCKSQALRRAFAQMEEAQQDGALALASLCANFTSLPSECSYLSPLPPYSLAAAQDGLQFVLDNAALFPTDECGELQTLLTQNGLMERKRIALTSTDRIDRDNMASLAKLDSIASIVQHESESLGKNLRMVILTDFIKKDLKKLIGTNEPLTAMGTVPIFEAIRRSAPQRQDLALLSGTLVLVPAAKADKIIELARRFGADCKAKAMGDCGYVELVISGSNKNKVCVLTEALNTGLVTILVGTKALLGEGWDSPCINSLILASFVGSFMLSNQMRGRAIRINPNVPDKASNIWHLATLLPSDDPKCPQGADYATLERRMDAFLGPAYHRDVIESGFDRLDILKKPYTQERTSKINADMLTLADDRKGMTVRWTEALHGEEKPELLYICETPRTALGGLPLLKSAKGKTVGFGVLLLLLLAGLAALLLSHAKLFVILLVALIGLPILILFLCSLARARRLSKPENCVEGFAKAVLQSLLEQRALRARSAKVYVVRNELDENFVCCGLTDASVHDKSVFSAAFSELLSAIDEPRYVLLAKGSGGSLACPSILAGKKENAARLAYHLERQGLGRYEPLYCKGEDGRRALTRIRRAAFLNRCGCVTTSKKRIR